jgi:GWxTD domain-containing protein
MIILSLSLLLTSCSYFARFYQPLEPREQLITDIWLVLDATQKKEIRELQSVEEIESYIDEFWRDMDPIPETEINEARIEYEIRLNYVQSHHRYKKGWMHSDQAQVYLTYGPPDDIYEVPWEYNVNYKGMDFKTLEIWIYDVYIADPYHATIFDDFEPNLLKFAFADLWGAGRYTQIFSNVPGEKIDPVVYVSQFSKKYIYKDDNRTLWGTPQSP